LVGIAVKVLAAPVHEGFVPVVNAIETDGVTAEFRVSVILFDVAGFPVTPGRFEVMTQVTTCPFVIVEDVYVVEFVPTFTPFTFHWYEGVVPPLVGVAVKVNDVPLQLGFVPAVKAIVTPATVEVEQDGI
jgi:hypothetical protein